MAKKFVFLAFILCCSIFAQEQDSTWKNNLIWRSIKGNFSNQDVFFDAAKQGFEKYYRRYSPKVFSRDDKSLIMTAKYGKYDVKCTFFIDTDSRHIVTIETDSKGDRFGRRDPIRWLENVVKQVENVTF